MEGVSLRERIKIGAQAVLFFLVLGPVAVFAFLFPSARKEIEKLEWAEENYMKDT